MGLGTAFRARMARGEIALGSNVRFSRSAEAGAILAACGFHWIMLDHEHSPAAPHLAQDIALGAIRAGVLPIARPAGHDPAEITGLLTNGALGLLVPHVDTPAQAAAVAAAARFAPRGHLSVPGTLPQFGYELPLRDACERFNDEVVVVAMIESATAVSNAAAIAGVVGIDGLFIGASDLLWDLGLPGRYDALELQEAVGTVCAAAAALGKFAGMGGPREEAPWRGFVTSGMRMVLTENDLSLLMRGARDRAAFFAALRVD
ncbi:aldolase/citrate lyase family protein [Falsiroseomonas sp. HW251]|uniref:aldolase/citrate lyase family protein n=1 Tax=Falsiroseomonas sp. HW251 TaxID=3390998 RepID=UPI003D316113